MNTFTVNFFLSWLKMGYTGNVPRNNVLKSFQSNLSTKVWVWFGEAYRLYFQLFFFKQPITYAYSQESPLYQMLSPLYQMLSNLWTNDPMLAVCFFFFFKKVRNQNFPITKLSHRLSPPLPLGLSLSLLHTILASVTSLIVTMVTLSVNLLLIRLLY